MAKVKKKRKAERVYEDDPEGEALLPARKTKEIAETHLKSKRNELEQGKMDRLGENEQGKEMFDFVLKGMVSPDKK